MRHKMLTQRALFCHRANTKRGTLRQHFMTHVVPPLGRTGGHRVTCARVIWQGLTCTHHSSHSASHTPWPGR